MEVLILACVLGVIPAFIAKNKGRSFFAWWIYGALLFIVALPHSLIMKSEPGSDEFNKREADRRIASGQMPDRSRGVDFSADGVLFGVPYHNEPDGSIVALVGDRSIRFRNQADLAEMLNRQGA